MNHTFRFSCGLVLTIIVVGRIEGFLEDAANTWSEWSAWSACDVTCGNGTENRKRTCVSGDTCVGDAVETSQCNKPPCPIHGGYGSWTQWSDCSTNCGNGTQHRTRVCDNPVPQNGGTPCFGHSVELIDCYETSCKVDGAWSDWTAWGACSNSCGGGAVTRTRSCDNPAPRNGGKSCVGEITDTHNCFEGHCPIDGGWGNFTVFGCSVTCGDGEAVEVRECNNPTPKYGGKDCHGLSHQLTPCSMTPCVIDGGWTEWTLIGSNCDSICGDGHVQRHRNCTNPEPANGGLNCTGQSEERFACNNGPCPIDIKQCNKTRTLQELHENYLYTPVRPTPCGNMNFIPQEALLKDVCHAPDDESTWTRKEDIRLKCDNIPLYSPIIMVHRAFNNLEYGIMLDCLHGVLTYATETCDQGVHEVKVDLTIDQGLYKSWDYYTITW
ncbi:hypothetical protein ACF0H5_023879 [Mactra antiquata]